VTGDHQEVKPLSHEQLSTPEMTAAIEKARSYIGTPRTIPGKTAEELLDLARDQRRVDTQG
jgi:hypothetical protein